MKTLFCQKTDLTIQNYQRTEDKPSHPVFYLFKGDYTRLEAERKLWEERDKTLKLLEKHFKYPVSRNVTRDVIQKMYVKDINYGQIITDSGAIPIDKAVIIEVD
jgi:hypothetical protein